MNQSAGARLKEMRLQKGISLEEAHKKTKIHHEVLRAIEEGSLNNFSPVYIKGFIKIYCRFLGVEPRDYIPDYKESKTKVEYVSADNSAGRSIFDGVGLKLSSLPFRGIKIKTGAIVIVIAVILAFALLFHLGRMINRRAAASANKAAVENAVIAQVQTAKGQSAVTQAIPVSKIIRLDIYARENSFIEVKTDGRLVFRSILKKGRAESWQGMNKIELSVGNASAVQIEVNGKRITPLGRKGQPLKNILITKDGLSIRR